MQHLVTAGGSKSDTSYQATTSTLQDLKARIQYADLPRTYCNAISVCRALKVRYLWIDSLCIIQDSKDDWEREAANMAYVYSNSYLTISADWSTDSNGGCFKTFTGDPEKDLFKSIHVTNVLSSGQRSCPCFLDQWFENHIHLDYTHLARKAWVYQERLLFRRNLHFTQHQLESSASSGRSGLDFGRFVPGRFVPGSSFLKPCFWAFCPGRS